jgi:hypothetical protein
MQINRGTIVVINGERGNHFGLVLYPARPDNNPNRLQLFVVRTTSGNLHFEEKEMLPVIQLKVAPEPGLSAGPIYIPDDLEKVSLEDVLRQAMPDIVLYLLTAVNDLRNSFNKTKVIRVSKDSLKNWKWMKLPQLPVQNTHHLSTIDLGSNEQRLVAYILKGWEQERFVGLHKKKNFCTAIAEDMKISEEKAEEIIESLIRSGIIREEDGWLIPLTPLLECATPHEVIAPGESWWSYTYTYYDVNIVLT